MRRPLVYGLLSCVLALLLYGLLHDRAPDGSGVLPALDEERRAARASAPLSADGAGPAPMDGPALESRAPQEAVDDPDAHGPVTVRVMGPDDTGLPSVFVGLIASDRDLRWIEYRDPLPVQSFLETDAHGEVVYRDLPYDGSLSAVLLLRDPSAPGGGRARFIPRFGLGGRGVPIRGAEVRFRAAVGLRLAVRAVEAETGKELPRTRIAVKDAYEAAAEALEGAAPVLMLWPVEDKVNLALTVQPPEGRLAWDAPGWTVRVSPYAKRLQARYPLRRELAVVLTVQEPDGSPTPNPEVFEVRAVGRNITALPRSSDAYGRLRITGVPHLPGETLTLKARRKGGYASAEVRNARIPWEAEPGLHLQVVLPPEPKAPPMIGIGGGFGSRFRGRGSSRDLGTSGSHLRPKGVVVVLVRRRDGSPAHGALVYLGGREARTDLNGRAAFSQVHPGEYAVRVQQVGLLPLSGKVRVRGEEQARLVLKEGPGGRLEVQVVDEEGRPLPYARLLVTTPSKQPWIDIRDGIQRVDPFTDHEGRRVLHGIEPGSISVSATWGSRSAKVTVQAQPGQARPVEIVLVRK